MFHSYVDMQCEGDLVEAIPALEAALAATEHPQTLRYHLTLDFLVLLNQQVNKHCVTEEVVHNQHS